MIPEFSGDFMQWLRGFYFTAQTGSMTAAADLMNRNQSAITHQIKCLEEELGVKLFSGSKGKRTLTNEGKHLFSKAVHIFEVISEVKENIGTVSEGLTGEINIAAFYTFMEFYLPQQVAAFCAKHPDIKFRINGGSLRETLFEKIYSRQVDFGLMVIESYPPEFKVDPLFCSDMVLISPTSGPYAVPQLPSLEQLTQLPFIYHPDNSSLEPFVQHQFARHGLTLRAGHMVSHCGALKKYVAQGMGVAIIDGFACTQEDRLSLNIVSLASFFPQRSFGIVRRRDMYMAEHVEAFLRFLMNNSGGNGESCAPDMSGGETPAGKQ